jgi:hypothetical protein
MQEEEEEQKEEQASVVEPRSASQVSLVSVEPPSSPSAEPAMKELQAQKLLEWHVATGSLLSSCNSTAVQNILANDKLHSEDTASSLHIAAMALAKWRFYNAAGQEEVSLKAESSSTHNLVLSLAFSDTFVCVLACCHDQWMFAGVDLPSAATASDSKRRKKFKEKVHQARLVLDASGAAAHSTAAATLADIRKHAAACVKGLGKENQPATIHHSVSSLTAAVCSAFFAGVSSGTLKRALNPGVVEVFELATEHAERLSEECVSQLSVLAYHVLLVQTNYGIQLPASPSQALKLVGMKDACKMLRAHGTVSRQPERFLEGLCVLQLCEGNTTALFCEWEEQHCRRDKKPAEAIWPPVLKQVLLPGAGLALSSLRNAQQVADVVHWRMVLFMYAAIVDVRLPVELRAAEEEKAEEEKAEESESEEDLPAAEDEAASDSMSDIDKSAEASPSFQPAAAPRGRPSAQKRRRAASAAQGDETKSDSARSSPAPRNRSSKRRTSSPAASAAQSMLEEQRKTESSSSARKRKQRDADEERAAAAKRHALLADESSAEGVFSVVHSWLGLSEGDLVASVTPSCPLATFLPFHPTVREILYPQAGGTGIEANPRAVLFTLDLQDSLAMMQMLAGSLAAAKKFSARNAQQRESMLLMTFGCVNNNGDEAATRDKEIAAEQHPTEDHLWPRCPSWLHVLDFIECDAHLLLDLRELASLSASSPSWLRSLYAKDVDSERFREAFFDEQDGLLKQLLAVEDKSAHQLLCGSAEAFHAHRARLRQRWTRITAETLKQFHPLFLNQSPLHRRSLANASCVDFAGVVSSYLYRKRNFSFFNLHVEQLLLTFVHYQATGTSTWIILAAGQMDKLDRLAADMFRARALWPDSKLSEEQVQLVARTMLFSKVMFPSITQLHQHKIVFSLRHLVAGQVLLARGDLAHCGFSTADGDTISYACNFCTDDSLANTLDFLSEHLAWFAKLQTFLQTEAGQAWYTSPARSRSKQKLLSPSQMVRKALFFAPCNFTCSWLRGLIADLRLLLLQDRDKPPVCEYPLLQAQVENGNRGEAERLLELCRRNFRALHKLYPFLLSLEYEEQRSCPACLAKDDREKMAKLEHSCMMCVCPLIKCADEEWCDQLDPESQPSAPSSTDHGEEISSAACAAAASAALEAVLEAPSRSLSAPSADAPLIVAPSRSASAPQAAAVAAAGPALSHSQNFARRTPPPDREDAATATGAAPMEVDEPTASSAPAAAADSASKKADKSSSPTDSTDLYTSGQYGELRKRLRQDGFLFLRGVIAREVVTPAKDALFKLSQSLQKDAVAVAFDALTGCTSTEFADPAAKKKLQDAAQTVGTGEAMTNLYQRAVEELCVKLCAVDQPAVGGGEPSFTLMPECTWMRVLSKKGKMKGGTPQHSDLMFFLRQTDRLLDVYHKQPHHQRAVEVIAGCAGGHVQRRQLQRVCVGGALSLRGVSAALPPSLPALARIGALR